MRGLALVTAAGFALILAATPALAHATYKSSNPPDEGTVSSAPSEITAEFTEPMTNGSYMDVTDPCGGDTGSGSSQSGSSMSVQNSGTAAGTYAVFWRAVSIDGHITEGEFTFTSTGGEPCPGEEEEALDEGAGGGGGTRSSSNSDSSSGGGDSTAAAGGSNAGGGSQHGWRHAGHGARNANGGRDGKSDGPSRDGSSGPVAQGTERDIPDAPSALEGIPVDGLILTLAVAALIGAAAGKIYVSLSGDER